MQLWDVMCLGFHGQHWLDQYPYIDGACIPLSPTHQDPVSQVVESASQEVRVQTLDLRHRPFNSLAIVPHWADSCDIKFPKLCPSEEQECLATCLALPWP